MSTQLKKIVISIADSLFLPVDTKYKDILMKPLRVLVLLFFAYSLIVAMPPVIEIVKEGSFYLPFFSHILENPLFWEKWLPYINFVIEIVFFLMIGGSVFSEWVASQSKETFKKFELAVEKAKEKEILDTKDELVEKIEDYYSLFEGITLKNIIPRIWTLYRTSNRIIALLVNDVAKVNAKFLGTKLAVSFPGGAYGLFAFLLFVLLVQLKIGAFYLPA